MDCVVSRSDGVRTIDIDRVRLCTGDVGTDGTATSLPFFLAASISSRAHPSYFSGCGVVEGKDTGGCVSGDGTLIDLGLCELERIRFAFL